jgi:hypothetical protein
VTVLGLDTNYTASACINQVLFLSIAWKRSCYMLASERERNEDKKRRREGAHKQRVNNVDSAIPRDWDHYMGSKRR